MRVDTVSIVPASYVTHGNATRCPDVRERRATRCPGHDEPMVLVYAVRLTNANIGELLRSYQLTSDRTLAETVRLLLEASLTAVLHRGIVGLRADDLAARGDIEIGKAHTL